MFRTAELRDTVVGVDTDSRVDGKLVFEYLDIEKGPIGIRRVDVVSLDVNWLL